MKTRIVQLPNGKFCVQGQRWWFSRWSSLSCCVGYGILFQKYAEPDIQYNTPEEASGRLSELLSLQMQDVKEV